MATTELALSRGFVEANPLGQTRQMRMAQTGMLLGVTLLGDHWLNNGHPNWGKALLIPMLIIKIFVVGHNVRVMW